MEKNNKNTKAKSRAKIREKKWMYLSVLEVMAPQGTNLVLATDVPHGKANVLVFDGFDVETNSRDSGNNFTKLKLVQNGGLTGGIKTNHKNAHLLLTEETAEQRCEYVTHDEN